MSCSAASQASGSEESQGLTFLGLRHLALLHPGSQLQCQRGCRGDGRGGGGRERGAGGDRREAEETQETRERSAEGSRRGKKKTCCSRGRVAVPASAGMRKVKVRRPL